jgi:NADH:ubiquinone oxidoreductase subunit E
LRVLVCVGPRCDADGRGRALLEALREALVAAHPGDSGRVALCARDCLRSCTREPVVRFEPSGEVYSNPSVADLLGLIAELDGASANGHGCELARSG